MRMTATMQFGKPAQHRVVRRTLLQACAVLGAALSLRSSQPQSAETLSAQKFKWLAFYGQTADEALLASYDIVVLDPMFRGSLEQVASKGARLCGYLSLGEIRRADRLYTDIDPTILIDQNPHWPGTYRIDVRNPSWKKIVLDEMIPFVARQGFTGVFLDTLDTPAYLEQQQPEARRGMREAAIDLVRSIRYRFPDMFVIINRGYALLPDLIGSMDAIVAESLLTVADDRDPRGYRWTPASEVAHVLSLLIPVTEGKARVPILSLDYWDPRDTETIRAIYARERQMGHHPYVATRMLDTIVPRPGHDADADEPSRPNRVGSTFASATLPRSEVDSAVRFAPAKQPSRHNQVA